MTHFNKYCSVLLLQNLVGVCKQCHEKIVQMNFVLSYIDSEALLCFQCLRENQDMWVTLPKENTRFSPLPCKAN